MARRYSFVASALVAAAFLASILTPSVSAFYFEYYVKWANQAINGSSSAGNCTLAAVDFLDFVYTVVNGTAPTVGTTQLTYTCDTCSSALDASLGRLTTSDPSVCPLLPYTSEANQTAVALRRFVCFGASGDGSGAAGSCVVYVVEALKSVKLLERIRTLDPSLRFDGSLLPGLCTALWPPESSPHSVSCCGRSWAYLMAALTRQLCLQDLSHEYESLPGRCTAILNRTVPGYCDASWPTDLLPLLTPPPAVVCEGAASSAAASSGSSSGIVAGWFNGSQCSLEQLQLKRSANNTCDLWCGILGEVDRVAKKEVIVPENSNTTNSTTSGADNNNSNAGGGSPGGRSHKLQTVTIVIICIFSVLIAVLLVALSIFAWTLYKERLAVKREQYQFDVDLSGPYPVAEDPKTPEKKPPPSSPPPSSPPPATPPPIGAPSLGPEPPTDSTQPTPTPRSASTPAEAVMAAAASGNTSRTPKYAPGPPPGPMTESMAVPSEAATVIEAVEVRTAAVMVAAVAAGPSQPYRCSDPTAASKAARALVFDMPTHTTTTIAANAAAAAIDSASRSSKTSKYGSAKSLAAAAAALGLGGGLSQGPGRAASDGNLAVMATAAAAPPPPNRLRSHRLSLSGSETGPSVYQSAFSRESFSIATVPMERSGSYVTALSNYAGGGGGGGGLSQAIGSETLSRGGFGALEGSPPR